MKQKKGVLLLNLGSPDSPEVPAVRRYLREFLMDGRVIDAPWPVRWLIVNAFILPFRPRESAKAYAKVWTPEGSPLIAISRKVQAQLQQADCPVYLAMNYGNPSIQDTLAQIQSDGIGELLIIPLYPHYAMSSYETVLEKARRILAARHPNIRHTAMAPFYEDEDYIEALYTSARPWIEQKPHDLILFSFHGIPERHLRKSDPSKKHCLCSGTCCETPHPAHKTCYRHQCLRTMQAFAARAGLPDGSYRMTFQSRLGRDPWLRPYTDQTLEELPGTGIRNLLVICPAFVTDCLETLEEIAMEGKESFEKAGGENYAQIPCLNDHPAWLDFLRRRIDRWLQTGESPAAVTPSATAVN